MISQKFIMNSIGTQVIVNIRPQIMFYSLKIEVLVVSSFSELFYVL